MTIRYSIPVDALRGEELPVNNRMMTKELPREWRIIIFYLMRRIDETYRFSNRK